MSPYSRSLSPPPPLPSPQLLPTPLPSPPTFLGRLPRRRLRILSQPSSPAPIPPRLIGSPLLNKTLNISRSYDRIDEKAKATLWVDGDEFGSNRSNSERIKDREQFKPQLLSPSFPSKRSFRRPSPVHMMYHSPPPSPTITSPPPPVPPIPAFLLNTDHKKPVLHNPPPLPIWPAKIVPDQVPCHSERQALRRKRGLSSPHHTRAAGLTCSQFMAMRNEPRRMGRITAM